jgi:ribosomal protein S18 acetylase RimI-like enzyme
MFHSLFIILNISNPFCFTLAYCNDIVVGAVCCRIDQSDNYRRLYIMTLGVLAKYRELGLGTVMLKHILEICEEKGNIDSIYL